MDNLFQQAELLYKNKNPACIELYEKSSVWAAKTKLAMIYCEGKCGQRVDFDKALEYTKGNNSYSAQAIEARIMVLEKGRDDLAEQYFKILLDNHMKKNNHLSTNIVLSNFYLQGKGVNIDFGAASMINPKLLDVDTFSFVFSKMPKAAQDALESDVVAKKHTIGISLIACARERMSKRVSSSVKSESSYYEIINNLWKDKKYEEAEAKAIEWFDSEKNESSAYSLLKYATSIIDDEQYSEAVAILKPLMHKPHNLKRLIYSSRKREKWDDFRQYMDILKEPSDEYAYDWAVLYELNGEKVKACQYYLKTVRLNPENHELNSFSIKALKNAFSLEPIMVLRYPQYAEELLKLNKATYTYPVCNAWIDYGNYKEKERGIKLLETIADKHLESAKKLYSLTNNEKYQPIIKKLEQRSETYGYAHFNNDDSTVKIIGYLDKLSVQFKIRALDILAARFLYGNSDVEKDYQKSSQYLLDEIDLCEQCHRSTKFPKAKLGLMMYNGRIPVLDEKTMFQYIYPLRDVPPYTYVVAECLLKGIGTDEDPAQAIELLNSAKTENSLRRLLKLYQTGKYNDSNNSKMFTVLSEMLREYEPKEGDVDILKELSSENIDYYTEISYGQYQKSKTLSLRSAGKSCDNPKDAIRYYDFARKLGDRYAAIQEALTVLNFFKNQRLAYTILRSANVDPQDNIYARIQESNEVMVNIDAELNYILQNN